MANLVANMAVRTQVLVCRPGGNGDKLWYDIYDLNTELREGLEEVVRVVIKNYTNQRAAYNLKPEDYGHGRRLQVRVGMLKLAANGNTTGPIQPIETGWVDIPAGESIDISIAPREVAVLEFGYRWVAPAAGGGAFMEPRFNLASFAGGTTPHIMTSKEASPQLTSADWAP